MSLPPAQQFPTAKYRIGDVLLWQDAANEGEPLTVVVIKLRLEGGGRHCIFYYDVKTPSKSNYLETSYHWIGEHELAPIDRTTIAVMLAK